MAAKKSAGIQPQIIIKPPLASEWTWAYRAMLGTLSAITIGLVSYLGLSIMENQRQMARDVSDLKTDLSIRIAGMQSNIGGNSAKIEMLQSRATRIADMANQSAQDIAVLKSRLGDLQATRPQP